jgi:hypothetical protein
MRRQLSAYLPYTNIYKKAGFMPLAIDIASMLGTGILANKMFGKFYQHTLNRKKPYHPFINRTAKFFGDYSNDNIAGDVMRNMTVIPMMQTAFSPITERLKKPFLSRQEKEQLYPEEYPQNFQKMGVWLKRNKFKLGMMATPNPNTMNPTAGGTPGATQTLSSAGTPGATQTLSPVQPKINKTNLAYAGLSAINAGRGYLNGDYTGGEALASMAPSAVGLLPNSVTSKPLNYIASKAAPIAGKIGLKSLGKSLPFVSTGLSLYDLWNRVDKGDYLGAGISGAQALAGLIPVPGVAAAVNLGLEGIDTFRPDSTRYSHNTPSYNKSIDKYKNPDKYFSSPAPVSVNPQAGQKVNIPSTSNL